jgi:hypothetical protein
MSPVLTNCASEASRTFYFGIAYLYRQCWDEDRAGRQGGCIRSHRPCNLGNAYGPSGGVAQDVRNYHSRSCVRPREQVRRRYEAGASRSWQYVRLLSSCDRVFMQDPLNTDGLANLEVMLHVVGSFGEQLPPTCHSTCQEVWPVFDTFLAKHGSDYESAEHVTRVLRHALNLFGPAVLTIAADVLRRMSTAFASSGFSCYLWIASKVHSRFGNEEDPLLRNAVKDMYERSTQKLFVMLREKSAAMLPDGDSFLFLYSHRAQG